MNLTSKRVIAGLLLAAAFTGVLIKELPWRDDAVKPGVGVLGATESELGQSQVLVQGETQTDLIDTSSPNSSSEEPKQKIPFAGVPAAPGKAFDSTATPDSPMSGPNTELPDPVAAISSRNTPPDGPAAFAPFLAGGNGNVPMGDGGNGGGNPGGGNPGGGSPGGGNPGGGSPGGGNPGGGQPPQNPPSDSPDNPPGDTNPPDNPGKNPPPDNPPSNPGDDTKVTPPTGGDKPDDPFVPTEPPIDYPSDPTDEPNPPTFPPENPLIPTGPGPDLPNNPGEPPTHSVPDTGSSLALLAIALSGLAYANRKFSRSKA